MKIASILNVHDHMDLVLDTLDSIQTWMTEDVLVIVDGKNWNKFENDLGKFKPNQVFRGFDHGHYASPYRNIALALKTLYKSYPEHTWYCYCEYDVIFLNDKFKQDLEISDAGVIANDIRWKKTDVSKHFQEVVGSSPSIGCTMLGCCVFYSHACVKQFVDSGVLDRLIDSTADVKRGKFDGYLGYAFEEFFFPTVASMMGSKVEESGRWHDRRGWTNRKYLMRFKPNIEIDEIDNTSSILHPCKNSFADCKIRQFYAEERKIFNSFKK